MRLRIPVTSGCNVGGASASQPDPVRSTVVRKAREGTGQVHFRMASRPAGLSLARATRLRLTLNDIRYTLPA
jgi:hypothetical protein